MESDTLIDIQQIQIIQYIILMDMEQLYFIVVKHVAIKTADGNIQVAQHHTKIQMSNIL